jgi:hypothetical protein
LQVRENSRSFKHADPDLIGRFPKKSDGEVNLEPHVKPGHQFPRKDSGINPEITQDPGTTENTRNPGSMPNPALG